MRLHVLGLEGYDAVAYYDQDIEFQGDIMPVLRCSAAGVFLSASGGVGEPLNIGFFSLKPDRRLLQAAVWFAQNVTYDNNRGGWGDSGFQPAGGNFVGSQCGQGFVHTLLHKSRSVTARTALRAAGIPDSEPHAKQIDRCVWNYQTGVQCPPNFDCRSIKVHHKPGTTSHPRDCPKQGLHKLQDGRLFAPDALHAGCMVQCVDIGASRNCNSADSHVKQVTVTGQVQECDATAANAAGDKFTISWKGSQVTATRTDSQGCWSQGFNVQCCIL